MYISFKLIIEDFLCKRDVKKLERKIYTTESNDEKAYVRELIRFRKALSHQDFHRYLDGRYDF